MHFILMKRRLMELQVVFIKNAEKEVKVAVLTLENSRAQTFAMGIKDILDYFELWASIKMIVTASAEITELTCGTICWLLTSYFGPHFKTCHG